jgi:hypothetical protein
MTNFGGDEWIHQQLSKHKEKIKLKEERRLKDKIVVRFNRRKFTELVKVNCIVKSVLVLIDRLLSLLFFDRAFLMVMSMMAL